MRQMRAAGDVFRIVVGSGKGGVGKSAARLDVLDLAEITRSSA